MQEIEILKEYIIHEIAAGKRLKTLDDKEPLLETGIIDSLGLIKLVTFIEAQFGVKVPDRQLIPENFETLADLSRMIAELRTASAFV